MCVLGRVANEIMRVVHINYDGAGWGGASIAMLRIHQHCKSMGDESIIACRIRPEHEDARMLPVSVGLKCMGFLFKAFMRVVFGHVYRSGLVPTGMAKFVNNMHPDKVVIHWLHIDTISLDEIARLEAPCIEWWVHDLWPISGTNPYPQTDWFKFGPPRENIISRTAWRRKCKLVRRIRDRLTVIGPSEWACREARESVVFRGVNVKHIPYPMSPLFGNVDSRRLTSKDTNLFVILFGAVNGTRNPIKGFDRLLAALDLIADEQKARMEIRVFGEEGEDSHLHGVRIRYLGALNENRLIEEYSAADVFAFPSRRETWGQVKSEAIACGCPVVAFDETACAEGIVHKANGWIAQSVNDFADGLRWYFLKKFQNS